MEHGDEFERSFRIWKYGRTPLDGCLSPGAQNGQLDTALLSRSSLSQHRRADLDRNAIAIVLSLASALYRGHEPARPDQKRR